jgi:glycerol-3-phosphate dehydrogenase (NAD(P)+)
LTSDLAVIGAGAWGTALAVQATRAGRSVTLWARDPARAAQIAASRENPRLPGVLLPETITVTGTLPHSRIALLAVPVQHMRAVLQLLPAPGGLVVCAKGLELGSCRLPLEILAETHPGVPGAVLTGPNFAIEIAAGLPAAAIVAAHDAMLRAGVIDALATQGFRLYGSDDPVAAQIGGAAKNVIAIAAGAVIGAGLGENARAALITRGLAEITRLAEALGGRPATVAGLSGLGDLLLTCAGAASRNTSLGVALGQGTPLADILAARSTVAEGVATAPALVARGLAAGVALPVCAAVARVVTGAGTLSDEIRALLARPLRGVE